MVVRTCSADNQTPSWRAALLRELHAAADADAAFRTLHAAVTLLGFDHYAYVLRVAIPITRGSLVAWINFPDAWRETYAARGYAGNDPILQFGQRCVRPMLWPDAGDIDAPFWADARRCGLHHGWSQTLRDHRGLLGTFSLARGAEPITQDELDATEPEMIWLGQLAHTTISDLTVGRMLPDGLARIRLPEQQVLHWTAEGKTVAEVAAILEMTERNVSFHIQNAITKLDAANKTHAVVKAALLGVIPAAS
jgi:LuxR family transcriptional regulator